MSGGYLQSDGGTINDYFKKRQVFYQGSSSSRHLDLFWQAGLSSKDFGASTFYSAAYPNQYEETRRIITSVKGDIKLLNERLILSPTLHWTRNVDHYQLIRDKEGAENGENYHRSDIYGGSLNAHLTWALGKTAAGMDIRKEHLISTAYGKLLQEEEWTPIGGSTRMYNRKGDRTNTSFFLEHNIILRKWTVSAGLLLNKNTGLDSKFRAYPGIDIAYRPNTHWKLYASWNKALRLPTYTDLYISNRVQQGDLTLRPERNSMFKAGVRYRTQAFEATLSGFYSRGRDMIDWVYETATSTRYHAPIRRQLSTGLCLYPPDALNGAAYPQVALRIGIPTSSVYGKGGPSYLQTAVCPLGCTLATTNQWLSPLLEDRHETAMECEEL